MGRYFSLEGKLALLLGAVFAGGAVLAVVSVHLIDNALWGLYPVLFAAIPLALYVARASMRRVLQVMRALNAAVASYRDGDYSVSLVNARNDELGDLVRLLNEMGATVREQRQQIVQRELLLDTVVQNTPVALVLTEASGRIAYANVAARHVFNDGRSLGGQDFLQILASLPPVVQETVNAGEDALFTVPVDGLDETFHVSRRAFNLQGRGHMLYLFRRMTRELSRQEVATWKKVIRVISHELNNSLAPISSLANSGAKATRRGVAVDLPALFAAISERVEHLHGFIDGYARFAKLPAPRVEPHDWQCFFIDLRQHAQFRLSGTLPSAPGWFDRPQIEQVLINLLKNAVEAGSAPESVELSVTESADEFRIDIADRGSGMSETVFANALLPFYSTKRSGTGLGLALTREIVEAHGGRIQLANRPGGGLLVRLVLPQPRGPAAGGV